MREKIFGILFVGGMFVSGIGYFLPGDVSTDISPLTHVVGSDVNNQVTFIGGCMVVGSFVFAVIFRDK